MGKLGGFLEVERVAQPLDREGLDELAVVGRPHARIALGRVDPRDLQEGAELAHQIARGLVANASLPVIPRSPSP